MLLVLLLLLPELREGVVCCGSQEIKSGVEGWLKTYRNIVNATCMLISAALMIGGSEVCDVRWEISVALLSS